MKKLMLICAALISWVSSAKAIDYVPESGFTNEAHVGMSISSAPALKPIKVKARIVTITKLKMRQNSFFFIIILPVT